MKFRGHETFFIRRGWLTKGLKYVRQNPAVFVDKDERPMDVLGIGANMVRALRYWMQATGLTTEPRAGRRVQKLTPLGELIYRYDRYLEEQGTLCLLQYHLATNLDEATAWYFFFNEFSMTEFTADDFIAALHGYAAAQAEKVAERSLADDFSCILGTYMPRGTDDSPEGSIVSPLAELGLVRAGARRHYRRSAPPLASLPPRIMLALLLEQARGRRELRLGELLSAHGSIGRAFCLDMAALLDVLRRVEDLGAVRLVRTAGLDVIDILTDKSSAAVVEEYYRALGSFGSTNE